MNVPSPRPSTKEASDGRMDGWPLFPSATCQGWALPGLCRTLAANAKPHSPDPDLDRHENPPSGQGSLLCSHDAPQRGPISVSSVNKWVNTYIDPSFRAQQPPRPAPAPLPGLGRLVVPALWVPDSIHPGSSCCPWSQGWHETRGRPMAGERAPEAEDPGSREK